MQQNQPLTAAQCKSIAEFGYYCDGAGPVFQVSKTLTKSWLFHYRGINGKRREMGLGAYPFETLAKAREKANAVRILRADGIDPLEAKVNARATARAEAAKRITLADAAEAY